MPVTTAECLIVTGVTTISDDCQRQHFYIQFKANLARIGLNRDRHAIRECRVFGNHDGSRQALAILGAIAFVITRTPAGLIEQAIGFRHVIRQCILERRIVVTAIRCEEITLGFVLTKTRNPRDTLPVNRQGQGLAYLHIIERSFFHIQGQAAERISFAYPAMKTQGRISAYRLRILCRRIQREIGLSALQ
ncbi:hypothetical protein D3C72_615180 [compost metagenome]